MRLHIFSNEEKHRKGTMKVAIKKDYLKLVSPEEKLTYILASNSTTSQAECSQLIQTAI